MNCSSDGEFAGLNGANSSAGVVGYVARPLRKDTCFTKTVVVRYRDRTIKVVVGDRSKVQSEISKLRLKVYGSPVLKELYTEITVASGSRKKSKSVGGWYDRSIGNEAKKRKLISFALAREGVIGAVSMIGSGPGILGNFSPTIRMDYDVPPEHHCHGTNGVRNKCTCRYTLVNGNDFTVLLPVLREIQIVRRILLEDLLGCRAQEVFSAVFGVTSVATQGTNGTRGLHYYFHTMKSLGSFCDCAMSVFLSPDVWCKLSDHVVHDRFRVCRSKEQEVTKAGSKEMEISWVINRETHERYSRIDIISGYAHYLRSNQRSFPSVVCICKSVVESGLYQQPEAPTEASARKPNCSKAVKEFLQTYDCSLVGSLNDLLTSYFVVANPEAPGSLVLECGLPEGTSTLFSDGYIHDMNVLAVRLSSSGCATVEELNQLFLMRYGPDGGERASEKECMVEVDGCRGLFEWSTGRMSGPSVQKVFGSVDMFGVFKDVAKVVADNVGVVLETDVHGYMCLSFAVNRFCKEGVRVRLPHLIMSPVRLVELNEMGCILARCIIPLDKAGLVVRVWPGGIGGSEKMVYVAPGTVLVLPASIGTSDCVRFSAQGQRRAEMLFAFSSGGEDVRKSVRRDPYYLTKKKKEGDESVRYSLCVNSALDREDVHPGLKEFVELFDL